MQHTINLPLLSRILTQPWALRRETLIATAQGILAGQPLKPQADSTWNVGGWDADGNYVRKPFPTQPGYTACSFEGIYASLRGTLPPVPQGKHVILVWGTLGRAWGEGERYWFDAIEVDEIVTAIEARPAGERIVLWFRSPGGITTGIDEAARQIRTLAQSRDIVAFTDDLCASAAYWLAAQCDSIHATPTAAIGSIGVYLAFYDYTDYLAKNGIKLELFKEGTLKAIGLPGNPLDEAARAHLAAGVAEAYAAFTAAVTAMRAIADEHMQGQCLQGAAALTANLADSVNWPSAAAFLAA